MNPGQEQFFNFIIQRVGEDNINAAKALLKENFAKQANGTFTREDMKNTQAELMKMLKPECINEVKAAMALFSSKMK